VRESDFKSILNITNFNNLNSEKKRKKKKGTVGKLSCLQRALPPFASPASAPPVD
jgi:hypothetical protein